jgi:Zn finger protein HypA/HybF involved in hydrogenase expression
MPREDKGTTKPGYVNHNEQITIRDTGEAGTDFGARNFQLACSKCGHNYGANSGDIWERKCPNCQGGAAGLPLKMGARG